jgi:hypothetical protein
MSLRTILSAALTAGVSLWLAGCDSSTTPADAGKTGNAHSHDEHGHEGHDHAPGEHGHEGHDHSHAHGPHDGHIVEIGEEEYHAEWTHDGKGKVTVYVLDKEMKKEVPIAAEKIAIETKIGETSNSFELEAVNRTEGDAPMASQFEITDAQLEGVLTAVDGKGVTATLKLKIGDKDYTAPITHDDHGHKH